MATPEKHGRDSEMAIRMRALRRAAGFAVAKDFAKHVGVTPSRLANFENGLPVSNDAVRLIRAKLPWVTWDWIMEGNEGGLTLAAIQRLTAALDEEKGNTAPPPGRSKSAAL